MNRLSRRVPRKKLPKCKEHPDADPRLKFNGGNLMYICDECGSFLYYQNEI